MSSAAITPGALAILEQARELLAKGWTQSEMARNAQGAGVQPQDARACSWCLLGAMKLASITQDLPSKTSSIAYGWLCRAVPAKQALSSYNDNAHRTKSEVITLLDNAIADARKELSL